ncbi:MAG: hypothetical protein MZV70_22455 [Desulfobacterales bacterium]|nr:hypothetical protein [Desulfobacterales bacterium]
MDADEQSRIEKEDEYTLLIVRLPVHDSRYELDLLHGPRGHRPIPGPGGHRLLGGLRGPVRASADNRVQGPRPWTTRSAFVLRLLGQGRHRLPPRTSRSSTGGRPPSSGSSRNR